MPPFYLLPLMISLAGLGAFLSFRIFPHRRHGLVVEPADALFSSSPAAAPMIQALCTALAAELRSKVIVAEKRQDLVSLAAGAPGPPHLTPGDQGVLAWCFANALPTRATTPMSAVSNWLFVPIIVGSRVRAVLGVADSRIEQSRDPIDDADIGLAVDSLQRLYGGSAPLSIRAIPAARIAATAAISTKARDS